VLSPCLLQFAQGRDGIEYIDIMDLYLLSCGNMQMRGRQLVTDKSHLGQLLRCDESSGTAYAEHIMLVLPLLVDTHRYAVAL
jgi:hypothetical protein